MLLNTKQKLRACLVPILEISFLKKHITPFWCYLKTVLHNEFGVLSVLHDFPKIKIKEPNMFSFFSLFS